MHSFKALEPPLRAPTSARGSSVVDEVLALTQKPDVIWGQLSVRNDEAAQKAEAAGIKMVMDRCPAIEYRRLIG